MRAGRLSREFAAALAPTGAALEVEAPTGSLLGVEHEFRVRRDGIVVDFAPLLASLDLGRLHLDPGDANARRLPSGAALTCDGTEAEVALPPIDVAPGFAVGAAARADAERAELRTRLADAVTLEGTSTHVSVAVDGGPETVDAVARDYARTFSAGLMLLLDSKASYGVYIRPRPGRLELCGEYVEGERLAAVAAFAAGSVAACAAALRDGLPVIPRLHADVSPSTDRLGYLVHRHAFGGDLYVDGLDATLPTEQGPASARAHLRCAWNAASTALRARGCAVDCDAVDSFLEATRELPALLPPTTPGAALASSSPPSGAAYGRLAGTLRRPGFDMAAVMLTWNTAVLVASGSARRHAFLTIPRAGFATFLTRLDAGDLDAVITAYLRGRPRGRSLTRRLQVAQPGLFDSLGSRRDLLPVELEEAAPALAAAA